jgi:plasmid stabilization system protein ParE
MSQVLKRPLAQADLDDIWDYIEERSSEEQAEDFLRRLNAKMETLARNPYIGRKRDELLPGLPFTARPTVSGHPQELGTTGSKTREGRSLPQNTVNVTI